MRRRFLAIAAAGLSLCGVGAVSAQPPAGWPIPAEGFEAPEFADGGWSDDLRIGPFFYPKGYDPQYGSGGRVADAAAFAAEYGCRPIWNAKRGTRTPACN